MRARLLLLRRRAAMASPASSSASSSSSSSSSPPVAWRAGSERALAASQRQLNAFLRESRARLAALLPPGEAENDEEAEALAEAPVVHVVLGNEAADADSIVSALVLAWAKRQHRHPRLHSAASSPAASCFLPVLPIPRDELALRCDVVALFRALGVDSDALVFVDEFPWAHARLRSRRVRLRATLVDHNALTNKRVASAVADLEAAVVEILDHHADLGDHADALERDVAFADGRALVASTCTLVAERLLAAVADQNDADHVQDDAHQDRLALPATLLLGVIALDSVGFDPRAEKVTARDVAAAEALEPLALGGRRELFDWLQAERFSAAHWTRFSLANCLRCDAKEFALPGSPGAKYGVSSVLLPLAGLAAKAADAAALEAALETHCAANDLALLLVMAVFEAGADGQRRRELLFFQPGGRDDLARQCAAFLREEQSLRVEPLALPAAFASARVLALRQGNAGASRKQVVPLLQRALARL